MIILNKLSKQEFTKKLKKIKERNMQIQYRRQLKEEKESINKKKVETSKLFAFYLFVLFQIVLVYSLVAMWALKDLACLGVLITDILAQILVYGIYCAKAYHGKKQEEHLKFEREKLTVTDVPESIDDEPTD